MECQTLEQMSVSVPEMGQQNRSYQTVDVFASGLSRMYTGPRINPLGGVGSPFGVVDDPDYLNGGIERYRKPEYDPFHGDHMNYETIIPGIKKPIINIHIPMGDE